MSRCPTTIKAQCYTTLLRPTREYASSISSPSKKYSINKVEAVQRRAARFATGDYQRTSSVTDMLQQLHCQTLQSRRVYAQTVIMYRIMYNLVDIPAEHHLNRTSLRTRGHSLRFLVPHTRTTVYRTSFFPQAICLWNQLHVHFSGNRYPRQLSRLSYLGQLSSKITTVFNLLTCTVHTKM